MKLSLLNFCKNNSNILTLILLILTLLCSVCLLIIDRYLTTDSCPNGIISFELAKELTNAQEMINSWDVKGKIAAGISVGFDYLYLVVYSSFINILIFRIKESLKVKVTYYLMGKYIIYGVFIAAIFDGIENLGLIQLLLGNEIQFWVSIAYYFAVIKFSLLATAILYLICGVLFKILLKIKREQ